MRLRVAQANVPATSVTDSATVILLRIVSTRPTRRAANSPQRRPQYDRTRMIVRRSRASRRASGDGVSCSRDVLFPSCVIEGVNLRQESLLRLPALGELDAYCKAGREPLAPNCGLQKQHWMSLPNART